MKRNLELILTFLLGIIFGVIYICTINAHTKPTETSKPTTEYVCEACTRKGESPDRKHGIAAQEEITESEPEVITETIYVPYSDPLSRTLTDRECDLLEQISMAEAKGEGTLGMMLVMNVVLNRAEKDGMSIEEVIFAEGQFYTEGMTPYVSEECHAALNLVIQGYDFSEGAIYFNKYGYRDGCEPVLQYKHHFFSK